MYRDANHCGTASRARNLRPFRPKQHFDISEAFDILCADFVRPLPRSKQGNSMLLVFHDAFSKWVELVPIRKATTALVQKAFRERILGRVGVPRKFVWDNGTQFTSRAKRLLY